jgi:aldehyde dehydrogenase (NAD+)
VATSRTARAEEVLTLIQGILGGREVGDPLVASTFFGPVINAIAAERIMGVIDTAKRGDARLVAEDERLGGELADGYFIAPTVFADVDNSSPLARDEIFGPVVAVMPFDTEEEAVRIANDSPFGLAAYVQTSNLKRAHTVAQQLGVGLVWVNGRPGPRPTRMPRCSTTPTRSTWTAGPTGTKPSDWVRTAAWVRTWAACSSKRS